MEIVVPTAMDSTVVTDKVSSGDDIQNDFLHFVNFISTLNDTKPPTSFKTNSVNMPATTNGCEETPRSQYTDLGINEHGINTSVPTEYITTRNLTTASGTFQPRNMSELATNVRQGNIISNDSASSRKRKRDDDSQINDRTKQKRRETDYTTKKNNSKGQTHIKKLGKDAASPRENILPGQENGKERSLGLDPQEAKDVPITRSSGNTLRHPTCPQDTVTVSEETVAKSDKKRKPKKRTKKRENVNDTSEKSNGEAKKGKPRKKKRKPKDKTEKKEKKKKKKSTKSANQRKNIKKLLKEEQLKAETIAAQLEEQRRLMGLHKSKGSSKTAAFTSVLTSKASPVTIDSKTSEMATGSSSKTSISECSERAQLPKSSNLPTTDSSSHTILTEIPALPRQPELAAPSSSVQDLSSKSPVHKHAESQSLPEQDVPASQTMQDTLKSTITIGSTHEEDVEAKDASTVLQNLSSDTTSETYVAPSLSLPSPEPPHVIPDLLELEPPGFVNVAPMSRDEYASIPAPLHTQELNTSHTPNVSIEPEPSSIAETKPTIKLPFGIHTLTPQESYEIPDLIDSFDIEPTVQPNLPTTPPSLELSPTVQPHVTTPPPPLQISLSTDLSPVNPPSIDFTKCVTQQPAIFSDPSSTNITANFPTSDSFSETQQSNISLLQQTSLSKPVLQVPAPITPTSDSPECIMIDSDSDSNEFIPYDMNYNGSTEQLSLDEIESFIKDCCETYPQVPDQRNGENRNELEVDEDEEDLDDNGLHTNDELNQPDNLGQVLVNPNHSTDEQDVFLAKQISKHIKPHQIGGIRFLYDNIVGSAETYDSNGGFGCILAHSMGLGKTLQVIAFIDLFLRHTSSQRVLCIVPVNTIRNWCAEFEMWLPTTPASSQDTSCDIEYRQFNLYVINEGHKTAQARTKIIGEWQNNGGVLLMGYEMYRLLVSKRFHRRRRKTKDTIVENDNISLEDERRKADMSAAIDRALLDPGPDLVICDEGHRIKNINATISRTLKNIRTRRRVVLTGYPLQNNLLEYWCMVDFVRPNFLGTKAEFCNLFERPIVNGQCKDSTPQDVKLMQYRVHVLFSLLKGFVQRRSHAVLKEALPQKEEHVVLVRLSQGQRMLYNCMMSNVNENGLIDARHRNPIKVFATASKIWNHPDLLYEAIKKRNEQSEKLRNGEVDLDFPDFKSKSVSSDISRSSSTQSLAAFQNLLVSSRMTSSPLPNASSPEDLSSKSQEDNRVSLEWATELMSDYKPNEMANSGKMMILFFILEESIKRGEKVLVFSQSLSTLDLIEKFLADRPIELPPDAATDRPTQWAKDKTYYRLDGGTVSSDRAKMINHFNSPNNTDVLLFLLSTRAGCLGVNLVGANRVIVYDASWNPCHDAQAVCRVYRYGQSKKCHVYRLVSENTMEKKIFDRQISKQGISDRVVDEHNPDVNLTKKDIETLLQYNENDQPYQDLRPESEMFRDPILANLCSTYSYLLSKAPFTHESLLIDREELKLTTAEKKAAKQHFRAEKR